MTETGSRIGSYHILRTLGRGGMGRVLLGRHEETGREVAIKVLPPTIAGSSTLLARFEREGSILARLDHPRIVACLEPPQRDGENAYFVMEYVDGRPLSSRLREGLLPLRDGLLVMQQVLEALGAAHQAGVVHRDVKPSNVLLDRQGDVKVSDFGLGRTDDSDTLTMSGEVMGTPDYMSPEQCAGDRVDQRTDIYSAGAMLYEIVCGRPPFRADRPLAILRKHMEDAPVPPASLRPGIPPSLEAVVLMALAKEPERRFQRAEDFAQALGKAARALPAQDPAPPLESGDTVTVIPMSTRPARRRSRMIVAVGALFFVMAAAAAWYSLGGQSSGDGPSPWSFGNLARLDAPASESAEFRQRPSAISGDVGTPKDNQAGLPETRTAGAQADGPPAPAASQPIAATRGLGYDEPERKQNLSREQAMRPAPGGRSARHGETPPPEAPEYAFEWDTYDRDGAADPSSAADAAAESDEDEWEKNLAGETEAGATSGKAAGPDAAGREAMGPAPGAVTSPFQAAPAVTTVDYRSVFALSSDLPGLGASHVELRFTQQVGPGQFAGPVLETPRPAAAPDWCSWEWGQGDLILKHPRGVWTILPARPAAGMTWETTIPDLLAGDTRTLPARTVRCRITGRQSVATPASDFEDCWIVTYEPVQADADDLRLAQAGGGDVWGTWAVSDLSGLVQWTERAGEARVLEAALARRLGPECLRARILAVMADVEPTLVLLDVGQAQGVRVGMRFDLYQDGQFKAVVQAVRFADGKTGAQVVAAAEGYVPGFHGLAVGPPMAPAPAGPAAK